MSKAYLGREVDSAFRKKGFIRNVSGNHIWYIFLNKTGAGYITQTKMSHGMMGSTLSSDLISKMARQLRLTKQQFLDLIDCRLSESGYRE
ncbi:MAG: hypothetical protein LBQ50_04600, partial [Planctomycetaceae bacterium]|nr:hypothetical protein [Planctomycetaceae bacterium]